MSVAKHQTILVASEGTVAVEVLGDALRGDDAFELRHARSVSAVLAALDEEPIDAILLADGHCGQTTSLLWREIRQVSPHVPIVVMTTDAESLDPPSGEPEDVWDAVICPVRLVTLMAVLRASLQRDGIGQRAIQIGRFRLDPTAKTIDDADTGQSVRLTEKEAAILLFLNSRPEGAVPREILLGEVWGYNDRVTTHTLETHIYRLRRKLEGLGPQGADLVQTEPGGYRLNGSGSDAFGANAIEPDSA